MDPLRVEKVSEAIAELSKHLPDTIEHITKVVQGVSDNKLKLKLEVMRQNLTIYRSKLAIAQLLLESEHELSLEALRDLMEMQNRIVQINYDLAAVVSSTARSSARETIVTGLVSLARKHPELLALPFGPPAAGGVWLARKWLARGADSTPDESTDEG